MNLVQVLNAQQTIQDGSRVTVGKGDTVRFTNLPNQPIAVVVYNNTGNNPTVHFAYANENASKTIASSQGQGFSMGYCYMIDPSVARSYETTVSLSNTAQEGATIDVYLVSLYFPLGNIQNQPVNLDGSPTEFNGYSRAYWTPFFAEYNLNITTTEKGLVGLLFQDNTIKVIGVNMPTSVDLGQYITIGAGMQQSQVTTEIVAGTVYEKPFYGTQSQMVYSPISAANSTNTGGISVQQLS